MNYASIADWFDLLQSEFSCCPEWIDLIARSPAQDSTASSTRDSIVGARIAAIAANGVLSLKEASVASSREAESVSTVWWLSQCLKKFRCGCTIDPFVGVDGFLYRNAHVVRDIPPRHYSRVKALLSLALPAICDEDVDPHFGPGAVLEGYNALEKWSHLNDFSYDADTMHLHNGGGGENSLHSRLQSVPKDYQKDRLITVEPAENSYGQQWVRSILLKSIHSGPLRGSVMDLGFGVPSEVLQRKRCIEASGHGRLATLDLKDASDSISWDQVVSVFPPWVVALLERFRTPSVSYKERDGRDGICPLYMYAGMGNATTFVVETLYFWACITAVCEWLGAYAPVTVFGDDIICGNPAASHPLFDHELKQFGIQINESKSGRSCGPGFREACGVVAHSGFVLHTLKRIPGFSYTDLGGLIDLCGLTNRLLGHIVPKTNYETLRGFPLDMLSKGIRLQSYVSPEDADNMPALWAHFLLGSTLASQLVTECGVPNLSTPLQSEGIWVSYVGEPYINSTADCTPNMSTGMYPCGERYSRRYSRLEYKVVVRRPKFRVLRRRHLTLSEGLGVLSGQLGHVSCSGTVVRSGRKRLDTRTIIKIPLRDIDYDTSWVPSI